MTEQQGKPGADSCLGSDSDEQLKATAKELLAEALKVGPMPMDRSTNLAPGLPVQFPSTVGSEIAKSLESMGPGRVLDEMAALGQRRTRREPPSKVLDLMRLQCICADQFVSDYADLCYPGDVAQDWCYEAEYRLLASAHALASEILCLLSEGYIQAARSRWRTLHETAVSACLVARHGTPLAERLVRHQTIGIKRSVNLYQRHCIPLGYRPYDEDLVESLEAECRALQKQFGEAFADDWGWATGFVPPTRGKSPKFASLEKAVGLEKMRYWYRLTSDGVHAGSVGISIALDERLGRHAALSLVDWGFAHVCHGALVSLLQTVNAAAYRRSNAPRLVVLIGAMSALLDRLLEELEAFAARPPREQGTCEPDIGTAARADTSR